MDDYPAKISDFLELAASRIRALTVDRVRNIATWTAVGMVAGTVGLVLFIFVCIGIFRALAELVGVELAYLILGGLFVILGALLWSRRLPKSALEPTASREARNG